MFAFPRQSDDDQEIPHISGSKYLSETRDEPPPNYYNENYLSNLGKSQDQHRATTDVSNLIQLPQQLMEMFDTILRAPIGVENLIEEIKAALDQQPATKHRQILDMVHMLCDICHGVYQPDRDLSSGCRRSQRQQEKLIKATMDDNRENTETEAMVQSHKDPAIENLPSPRSTYAEPLRLNRTRALKKRGKSIPTSLSTEVSEMTGTRNINRGAAACNSPLQVDESTSDETSSSEDHLREETPNRHYLQEDELIYLARQPIEEFIDIARNQIRRFDSLEIPSATYQVMLSSLQDMDDDDEVEWSMGLEWASLVETGYNDRKRGTIKYAITAMAFQKWHASQVRLRLKSMTMAAASQQVTSRLIGFNPASDHELRRWNQRRKNISTHLTRGKKWCRLVKELGLGILFINAWKFAKTKNIELDRLIKELSEDQRKMAVLDILTNQLKHLIEKGRTSEVEFDKELQHKHSDHLLFGAEIPNDAVRLHELWAAISEKVTSGRLLVDNSKFEFNVASILTLQPSTWLNDDIVIACLHLSDKLPFVRVGWSVPVHQDIQSHIPMSDPFERAAAQVAAWCEEMGDSKPVCFFPLFQHANHFTLLEINEREGQIYHYDSMGGMIGDVEEACNKAFPHLHFSEKEGIQQNDGDSCGLMVIKHAQRRMLGWPAVSDKEQLISSEQLRFEATHLLRLAWDDGTLIKAPACLQKAQNARILSGKTPIEISDSEEERDERQQSEKTRVNVQTRSTGKENARQLSEKSRVDVQTRSTRKRNAQQLSGSRRNKRRKF